VRFADGQIALVDLALDRAIAILGITILGIMSVSVARPLDEIDGAGA
jgi:hypothetical protein